MAQMRDKTPCAQGWFAHARLYWRFWREWPSVRELRRTIALHRERHA